MQQELEDQTGRAYDEAQERGFRALHWHVRLTAHLMGFLTMALMLALVLIAFGWPVLKRLREAE